MKTTPGTTARVIVTARPSPKTVETTRDLLEHAATTAGAMRVALGVMALDDASAWLKRTFASFQTALDGRPCEETTARLVAHAIRTAGGQCGVIPGP